MPRLVDLTAAPYGLDADQIAWVEETLAGMTLDEQVGQLFTNPFFLDVDEFSGNRFTAEEILERFDIGVARHHGGTSIDELEGTSEFTAVRNDLFFWTEKWQGRL